VSIQRHGVSVLEQVPRKARLISEQVGKSSTSNLGGVDQRLVKDLVAIIMIAVGLLLAVDAKWSPRNGNQPLGSDFLFTVHTDSERTILNTAQSRADISQQVRFAVKISYCEVSFRGVLYFIQFIRALLNHDSIATADDLFQFRLSVLENLLKCF